MDRDPSCRVLFDSLPTVKRRLISALIGMGTCAFLVKFIPLVYAHEATGTGGLLAVFCLLCASTVPFTICLFLSTGGWFCAVGDEYLYYQTAFLIPSQTQSLAIKKRDIYALVIIFETDGDGDLVRTLTLYDQQGSPLVKLGTRDTAIMDQISQWAGMPLRMARSASVIVPPQPDWSMLTDVVEPVS